MLVYVESMTEGVHYIIDNNPSGHESEHAKTRDTCEDRRNIQTSLCPGLSEVDTNGIG
jgi:hypothetical protein